MQGFHTLLKLGRRSTMEKIRGVTGVMFSGEKYLSGISTARKRNGPCQRRPSK
jgi:hypothetical protein